MNEVNLRRDLDVDLGSRMLMMSNLSPGQQKAHILLAEDDINQANVLKFNLEAEGYDVEVVNDGESAIQFLTETTPDLVILDWMMPKVSGIRVLQSIRSQTDTKSMPVIMLTARGDEDDRVRSFEVGVDDYVTKPYLISELNGRIKALLRRANPAMFEDVMRCGDVVLDRGRMKVTRGKREIKLRSTEFRVLFALMSQPGRVLSRSRLIDLAWGVNRFVEEQTVNVSIKRLRSALLRGNEKDPIRTVRGGGYSIECPELND